MPSVVTRLAVFCALLVALALQSPRAEAKTTLEARIVDVDCSVTTSDGAVSVVPCNAGGWTVTLAAGSFARMVASIDVTYADDGLALPPPGAGFQMDTAGFITRFVDHEAAALYALTSNCLSRYCSHPPGQDYTGASGFPPVFLSDNDVADSFSTTLTVTTGAEFNATGIPSWTPTVYITLLDLVYSVDGPVAAIPEPGTLALSLLSLLGVTGALRRRYQDSLPVSPLNGPVSSGVIQPP